MPPTLSFLSLQFRQPNLDLVLCGILCSRGSLVNAILFSLSVKEKGFSQVHLVCANLLSETRFHANSSSDAEASDWLQVLP